MARTVLGAVVPVTLRVAAVAASLLVSAAIAARPADLDRDGITDADDNCPEASNPAQLDADGDGVGNACDVCAALADADAQDADADADGVGDACDACAGTAPDVPDGDERLTLAVDGEGCSVGDRCPCVGPRGLGLPWRTARHYRACVRRQARVLQRWTTITAAQGAALQRVARESRCGARVRSAADRDGDGVAEDGDESGASGDAPCAGGTIAACDDNCPRAFNRRQRDLDGDGHGDACDADVDGDGLDDGGDVCPRVADPEQADADDDGVGDACDRCTGTPEAEDVDRRGCGEDETPATG